MSIFISSKLKHYLTVSRAAMCGSFIDAVGTGTWISASAVVFSQQSQVSPTEIGFGLTLSAITGMLASVPVGILADRIGGLKVFTISYFLRALGMILWLLIDGPLEFLIYISVFGIIDRSAASLTRSLIISPLDKDEAVRVMGRCALPTNVGYGIGALLASSVLASNLPLATILYINSASFIGVIAVYRIALADFQADAKVKTSVLLDKSVHSSIISNRDRFEITFQNFVLSFHRTLLTVFLPLELLKVFPQHTWIIPLVTIANSVIVAATQGFANSIAVAKNWAITFWGTTSVALALSLATISILWVVPVSWRALIFIVLIATQIIAEVLHSAALSVFFVRFSRSEKLAQDLSAINLGGQLQNIVGPALFAILVVRQDAILATVVAALLLAMSLRIFTSQNWKQATQTQINKVDQTVAAESV